MLCLEVMRLLHSSYELQMMLRRTTGDVVVVSVTATL